MGNSKIPKNGGDVVVSSDKRLILASASPRRRRILSDLGLLFDVVVTDVAEHVLKRDARRTAAENARNKLEWCRARYAGRDIVAADTVIDFEGECLTKPDTRAQAFAFLRRFSGRSQTVITGVALSRAGGEPEVRLAESDVRFKTLSDADIEAYFERVDPMDKAGAYDIDQSGELIIASYTGSWTNIMGLPREVIEEWLRETT